MSPSDKALPSFPHQSKPPQTRSPPSSPPHRPFNSPPRVPIPSMAGIGSGGATYTSYASPIVSPTPPRPNNPQPYFSSPATPKDVNIPPIPGQAGGGGRGTFLLNMQDQELHRSNMNNINLYNTSRFGPGGVGAGVGGGARGSALLSGTLFRSRGMSPERGAGGGGGQVGTSGVTDPAYSSRTILHKGFFDLLSLLPHNNPPNANNEADSPVSSVGDPGYKDTRWDWEYDENGRMISPAAAAKAKERAGQGKLIKARGNERREEDPDELIGRRYEDYAPGPTSPGNKQNGQNQVRPAGRREPSEAANLLRSLQAQSQSPAKQTPPSPSAPKAYEPVRDHTSGNRNESGVQEWSGPPSGWLDSIKGLGNYAVEAAGYVGGMVLGSGAEGAASDQGTVSAGNKQEQIASPNGLDAKQKLVRKPVPQNIVPVKDEGARPPIDDPSAMSKLLSNDVLDWKPRGQVGTILAARGRGRPAAGMQAPMGKVMGGVDKKSISWPLDFQHVAHAENEEEAMFLLMRWGLDGMGKIADPVWAGAIKALVKQRAADQQARAIAQSMINRERGIVGETPFQTLRVVNGMPSSVYSITTIGTLRPANPHAAQLSPSLYLPVPSPGFHGSVTTPSARSPLGRTLANPFEKAFQEPLEPTEEEKAIMARDKEVVIKATLPLRIKSKKATASVKLQDLVADEAAAVAEKRKLPEVVKPEDIDGLPFPSLNRAPPDVQAELEQAGPVQIMVSDEQEDWAPVRDVTPSLPTLEKAASVAIYFETLYHALLKPPKSLDAAHPNNYILNRQRREIALEQEMERKLCTEPEKETLRRKWREAETKALRDKRRKVEAASFAKLKVIGHGAFGVVTLVGEKDTGKLFAMKELRKSDMLRKGQEGHVRAEKDLLAAAANAGDSARWIVKLHYSFQDRDKLYLILDYEGGGDLLNLLVERDTFDEEFTRFYIAEMVLAIEATHKLGFIHRDIKPDNFLFSKEGHLKISDFGLANSLHWAYDTAYYEQQRRALLRRHGIDLEEPAMVKMKTMKRKEVEAVMGKDWLQRGQGMLTWRDNKRRKLAMSVCGTNSYMAPEVIRGMGYGFSCDWWSLGCIAFECLYGFPPFMSSTRHQTRQKILNWRQTLRFPTKPRLSRQCTDFLTALLCEPEDRLDSRSTASVNRPNSLMIAERSVSGSTGMKRSSRFGLQHDGADEIKSHPWFKNISWDSLHEQSAPYQPNLANEADTRHFDDDIPNEPLAPPGGAPAHATKDPMLADKYHGPHLLELRKQMAFAGWTYKANKHDLDGNLHTLAAGADRTNTLDRGGQDESSDEETFPIRPVGTIGRSRALSL